MAAFAFARLRFPGRTLLFGLVFSTIMLPSIVTLIPTFIVFRYLHWINTFLPLIVPFWLGGGAFNIFLFRQFFMTIPYELDEAARIDGASNLPHLLEHHPAALQTGAGHHRDLLASSTTGTSSSCR